VWDDLLDFGGSVLAALFQGCFVSFAIVALTLAAIVSFATGDAHEGWVEVGLLVLSVVWGLVLLGRWVERLRDVED
jgi:hypothetical protein